jgi:hypothetical protein
VTGRSGDAALLRGLLFLIVMVGAIGLIVELLFLEHTESVWQWVPLVLLALTVVTGTAVAVRPGAGAFRIFRWVMLACVGAGVVGLYLHYRGNIEWELESDPSLRGPRLAWTALHGATPTLAPAALAQLGLLGLLFTFRHPARNRSGSTQRETR